MPTASPANSPTPDSPPNRSSHQARRTKTMANCYDRHAGQNKTGKAAKTSILRAGRLPKYQPKPNPFCQCLSNVCFSCKAIWRGPGASQVRDEWLCQLQTSVRFRTGPRNSRTTDCLDTRKRIHEDATCYYSRCECAFAERRLRSGHRRNVTGQHNVLRLGQAIP